MKINYKNEPISDFNPCSGAIYQATKPGGTRNIFLIFSSHYLIITEHGATLVPYDAGLNAKEHILKNWPMGTKYEKVDIEITVK